MTEDEHPKLSRFEIVGAWLNVWTPPRDAEIPPVPWRALGLGLLAALVVGGAALAFAAPRIDDAKDESATRDRQERAERAEARRARQIAEQRPRFGAVPAGAPRRTEVLAVVEEAIGRDARARFHPRAKPATCEPTAGVDEGARRVAYDCFSTVREIVGAADQEGAQGSLAIPFRAVIDFADGSYAFCKINPIPGEQVIPDPRKAIPLPVACRVPKLGPSAS